MSALVKISNDIITSSGTHTVTLSGIDSTYNTYMVKFNNVQPATDNKNVMVRLTKGGSIQSDTKYDYVHEDLKNATFVHTTIKGSSAFVILDSSSNAAGETNNGILYLFHWADANEYSWITYETARMNLNSDMGGRMGGGAHEVASASDGIVFTTESSVDFANGAEFTLYGLKN